VSRARPFGVAHDAQGVEVRPGVVLGVEVAVVDVQ
jgi:hypothetical protein